MTQARRWWCAAVAGLAATLALAGCANDDSAAIGDAFDQLRRAYLAEDYAGVCSRLSPAAMRELGNIGHTQPTTCARDMRRHMPATVVSRGDLAEPEIRSIDVDGDHATVVAVLGGTAPTEVRLVKDAGAWKLDRLFATSAPPPLGVR